MPWHAYRDHFLTAERIDAGVAFWTEHRDDVAKVARDTGVAPHVIIGILGAETFFGRITGKYRVVDALSTLAFDYPPRATLLPRRTRAVPAARERGKAGYRVGPGLLRRRDGRRRSSCRAVTAPTPWTATATAGATSGASWDDVIASVANYLAKARLARRRAGRRAGEPLVPEGRRPRRRQARAGLDGEGAARPRPRLRHDARATRRLPSSSAWMARPDPSCARASTTSASSRATTAASSTPSP